MTNIDDWKPVTMAHGDAETIYHGFDDNDPINSDINKHLIV
jgi:hypothetical protein